MPSLPQSLLIHRRNSSDTLSVPSGSQHQSQPSPHQQQQASFDDSSSTATPSAASRSRSSTPGSGHSVGSNSSSEGGRYTRSRRPSSSSSNTNKTNSNSSSSSSSARRSTLRKGSFCSSYDLWLSLRIAITLCVVVTCITVGVSLVVSQLLSDHDERVRATVRQDEFAPLSHELQDKLRSLEGDKAFLTDRLTQIETDRDQLVHQADAVALLPRLQDQVHQLQHHVSAYKTSIQKMSRARLLERFGAGPHFVELAVAFHPSSLAQSSRRMLHSTPMFQDEFPNLPLYRIVLRLAPYTDMPHATHWFLEQVSRGLYDGTSFHSRADHVVQAGPVENFMSTQQLPPQQQQSSSMSASQRLYRRFRDAGLEGVLFQEYHEKWPHLKYTVGYAGRPGGPDFYFNMGDNSSFHGPGGQASNPSEADPCFAIVVQGYDVVDQLHNLPVEKGGQYRLTHNAAIVSMRIMEANEI